MLKVVEVDEEDVLAGWLDVKEDEGVMGISRPQICAAMLVRRWWWRWRMIGADEVEVVGVDRVDAVRFRDGEGDSVTMGMRRSRGSMVRWESCVRPQELSRD
jgi:hypothetical protein